jgi:hypothetical protein
MIVYWNYKSLSFETGDKKHPESDDDDDDDDGDVINIVVVVVAVVVVVQILQLLFRLHFCGFTILHIVVDRC